MIADRYYYNRLSGQEKEIYTALYKGVVALEKEIFIPFKTPSEETVHRVFSAVTHDNPHLYYFNQTFLNLFRMPGGVLFKPQYFCSQEQICDYNGRLEEAVNRIIQQLDLQRCSDLEKEKRIHDYFVQNVVYDHEALHTSKVDRLVAAHSVIGVFAKQRGVCEGISKAAKLLFNTVDMGCIVVSGSASFETHGGHAWNIVKIDGKPYHMDLTWDMANSKAGQINYDYFNLPDIAIRKDHSDFSGVPACDAWDANYFLMNSLYFRDMRQLEAYLMSGIQVGGSDFYFRIAHEGHDMNQIMVAARDFAVAVVRSKQIRAKIICSCNLEQRTGRIVMELLLPNCFGNIGDA